ncbi:right-handed parallel beta-helix repeat-containing protein [bacterium]|nr:right-handed parallel beta-helix repeat-containing protein [candidate division CSSED10-310 bacterium]
MTMKESKERWHGVRGLILLAGVLVSAGLPAAWAATWVVPGDFPDLRTAYDAANGHDTILVRPGHYSGDNWTEIFFFDKPVNVIGEAGPAATVIDGRGIDRAIHFRDLHDDSMLFEGFTITNCVGEFIGAVTFHENSSGTLRNCIIENCHTTATTPPVVGEGGGLRIWGSSPVIEDVIIRNCHALQGGGCNILVNSNPVFRRVRIENCSGGGVMASENCNPYFEDCVFTGNTASEYSYTAGVGIYIGGSGHFVRCLIAGNTNTLDNSGGVHIGNSTTVFDHCMIINNSAVDLAGGVMCHQGATPVFNYCTLAGNSAGSNGDGIGTFGNSRPVFNDCIIWQPGNELYSESGGTADFMNCNISTDIGGSNWSIPPMFIDETYHIDMISPCRDRGRDTGERIDIDGDWVENAAEIWDVGADEIFQPVTGSITATIDMPQSQFRPGDGCYLKIGLSNRGSGILHANLILVLDVYGDYFMWPSWGDHFDRGVIPVPSGGSETGIFPFFIWPTGAGTASGLAFYAGLMNMELTEVISNVHSFSFGWTE